MEATEASKASEASTLETARSYADRGWKLLPANGKTPLLLDWRNADQRLDAWFAQWPDANVGLVLGARSGVVRLDADGEEAMRMAVEYTKDLETAEFTTASGGRGWLFEYSEVLDRTVVLWKGANQHQELRVQSTGAMTLVPPSRGYVWVRDSPILPLPLALQAAVLERKAATLLQTMPTMAAPDRDDVLAAVAALTAEQASNRDIWLSVGFALHAAGDEYMEAWIEWSRKAASFRDGECEAIWARMQRNGRIGIGTVFHHAKDAGYKPRRKYFPLTDAGNSRALANACEGKAKYVLKWDAWVFWSGKRWCKLGADLQIQHLFIELTAARRDRAVRSLVKYAALSTDEEKQKFKSISEVLKWCKQSHMYSRIMAATRLVETVPGIAVSHDEFNRKPWLLNCTNGTVNLANGELREHDPADMLTQICPTEYRPEALCPRWEQHILEVFPDDEPLRRWFQKLLGYCITGFVGEQILPVWHGGGANGKGTVVRAMQAVLGSTDVSECGGGYTAVAPSKFLAMSDYEKHEERFVPMYSARFVTEQETSDRIRMDEELVKKLTGADRLTARNLYKDRFEWEPTHKLVLATNHQPLVSGTDVAIWRRIKLVPFLQCFEGRKDSTIDEQLKNEAPGILAWLVRGCMLWQAEGLNDQPAAVVTATAKYRSEQDTVAEFLTEMYELTTNPADKLTKAAVLTVYRGWCIARGIQQVSDKTFGVSLSKAGVEKDNRYYMKLKQRMNS